MEKYMVHNSLHNFIPTGNLWIILRRGRFTLWPKCPNLQISVRNLTWLKSSMAWVHCAPGNVYEFDWPSSYVHQYEKTTISAISRSSTFGLDRLRYGTVGCRKAGFDNNPWTEKPVGRAGIAIILHLFALSWNLLHPLKGEGTSNAASLYPCQV